MLMARLRPWAPRLLLSLSLCWTVTVAQIPDMEFVGATDLTNFVTRPELKAPLFKVEVYDKDALDAGYWFIGAYGHIFQNLAHPKLHLPCQTGPHIYDQRGELVWSGACAVENRVSCDFRVFESNGKSLLSVILLPGATDKQGSGVILDSSYSVVKRLTTPPGTSIFNMHELTYVNEGSRALFMASRPTLVSMPGVLEDSHTGWIIDLSIHEVDLNTGEIAFEWWASNHIEAWESSAIVYPNNGPQSALDWLHINSVNKNEDGDYIMSARNTNAIYKISGKDGSILWRLGGKRSTFDLIDFDFSRQHDAQWITYNDDVEIIEFLDNGGDEYGWSTSNISSVLVVRLDKTADPPRATVVERIDRPDGGKTERRGNLQHLPNGNRFISWSDNSYFTEHAPDGRLLMSARFATDRFVTYRAYKFPFEGFPTESPRLHVKAYSAGKTTMLVYHVSWNGATNVARWRFWRDSGSDTKADSVIGEAQRTGFETSFSSEGFEARVYAEAVGHDGASLGRTPSWVVEPPRVVHAAGIVEHDERHEKDDEKHEKDEL